MKRRLKNCNFELVNLRRRLENSNFESVNTKRRLENSNFEPVKVNTSDRQQGKKVVLSLFFIIKAKTEFGKYLILNDSKLTFVSFPT